MLLNHSFCGLRSAAMPVQSATDLFVLIRVNSWIVLLRCNKRSTN